MHPVSASFRERIAASERRVQGRVIVDFTDPFLDQTLAAAANESAVAALVPQVADAVTAPTRRWASLDGSTFADGLSFPMPSTPAEGQVGWWGTQLAGTGGVFVTPFPTLTVTFASRPVHELHVVGDSARGEWPVDFEVRLLGAGGVVRHTRTVTGNTLVDWREPITPVTEVTSCVLEVRRWSHAGRQVKILEFFTSIEQTYEAADLMSLSLLEERELAQDSLPVGNVTANELMVRINNADHRFDAGNRQSPLFNLLRPNRRIRAWLGAAAAKVARTETSIGDWQQGALTQVQPVLPGGLQLAPAVAAGVMRDSIAFLPTGEIVNARHAPRYVPGRFGQALLIEEGTTNRCTEAQSRGRAFTPVEGSTVTMTFDQPDPFGGVQAVRVQASGGTSLGKTIQAIWVPASGVRISGQLWARNRIATTLIVHSNLGGRHRSLLPADGWQYIRWEDIVGDAVGSAQFNLRVTAVADSVDCDIAWCQYEEKPYCTSWQLGGTPRAVETAIIDTTGIVDPAQGSVEWSWTPVNQPASTMVTQFTSPQVMRMGTYHSDGSWVLWAWNLGTAYAQLILFVRGQGGAGWTRTHTVISGAAWYVLNQPVALAVTWTGGTTFHVWVNGVRYGPFVSTHPLTAIAGNVLELFGNSSGPTNARYDDLRISSRARTDAEIQAAFASGAPLPVDADTTLKLNFDGRLHNFRASGSRVSPVLSLAPVAAVQGSRLAWTAATPAGTGVAVDARLSADGGATWGGWQPASNGGAIPGLPASGALTNHRLELRQTLTASADGAETPILEDLTATVDDIEYVPLGTFWSGEWHARTEDMHASTTGRDRLELLRKSTYAASQVAANQSLHALAVAVLTDAGLSPGEYWVDPALQAVVVPHAWFGTVSHREALRQLAEASLGQVYVDRHGIVRVEGPAWLLGQETFVSPALTVTDSLTIPAGQYFRKDTPVKWGEVANRIEVETQPLRPVAAQEEVWRSNAPHSIAAGQTVTVTAYYTAPPVIEGIASLEGAPTGASIAAASYFAWGATVSVHSPLAGSFTLVLRGRPLRVLNRERAVAEDAASVRDHGLLRYRFAENHLVQGLAQAQFIADTLLRLYRHPRRDLSLDWRGNPALLLGDTVITQDHGTWLRYWAIRQELDYDGGLRARLEGRLAR